jgi:hypothetical protein
MEQCCGFSHGQTMSASSSATHCRMKAIIHRKGLRKNGRALSGAEIIRVIIGDPKSIKSEMNCWPVKYSHNIIHKVYL